MQNLFQYEGQQDECEPERQFKPERYITINKLAIQTVLIPQCLICKAEATLKCIFCNSHYCNVEHLEFDNIACHQLLCPLVSKVNKIHEIPQLQQSTEITAQLTRLLQECRRISYIKAQSLTLERNYEIAVIAALRSYSFTLQLYGDKSLFLIQPLLLLTLVNIEQDKFDDIQLNFSKAIVFINQSYQKQQVQVTSTQKQMEKDVQNIQHKDILYQNNFCSNFQQFFQESVQNEIFRTQDGRLLAFFISQYYYVQSQQYRRQLAIKQEKQQKQNLNQLENTDNCMMLQQQYLTACSLNLYFTLQSCGEESIVFANQLLKYANYYEQQDKNNNNSLRLIHLSVSTLNKVLLRFFSPLLNFYQDFNKKLTSEKLRQITKRYVQTDKMPLEEKLNFRQYLKDVYLQLFQFKYLIDAQIQLHIILLKICVEEADQKDFEDLHNVDRFKILCEPHELVLYQKLLQILLMNDFVIEQNKQNQIANIRDSVTNL